ncbi:MAG: haloalkane dehalogenase [Deltaproteobacteria bacterium]|nr:haloalkane dehalogenase [Deltaproteobacteria bacterium]
MKILRTPDSCFNDLPDYPFAPHYADVPDSEGGKLRIHYVDEGPKDADPVLLMHGEPSWSYLYRKMIPIIIEAGHRAIAPDLVGFGRSDKPSHRNDYTYQRHVDWIKAWLTELDLKNITLVCQDWGGLIGLRLVADDPDRFARVVAANTGFPSGSGNIPDALKQWRQLSLEMPVFDIDMVMKMGMAKPVSDDVLAAYNAPFPDETYKEGARIFPSLIPVTLDDPAAHANQKAWEVLCAFEKPFLTAFSDKDPITQGGEIQFQNKIPGAKGQPHTTIKDGGHFLQEDCGEEFAKVIVDFISNTSE